MTRSKAKPKNQRKPWQEVAAEAQAYRDATLASIRPSLPEIPSPLPRNVLDIPRQILQPEEVRITEMLPEELLSTIAKGELTAVAVTTAFLRRAGVCQGLTNCIAELLPSFALSRASELDAYFQQHNKTVGSLHGLPISVKEHIGFANLSLTSSYVSFWNNPEHPPPKEDARLLKILRDAGAVFHARTTQPQGLMHLETDSNLYGVTCTPYARDLSAGGSSGGEGALIGGRGSILGIGSDIGGSIRSPASANGIYGLKPTAFRIPTDGWSSTFPGADAIVTSIGPLSVSLSGISLFMSTILSSQPWLQEPDLIPLPWRPYTISPSPNSPLRIGIMWTDGVVQPHPPITRALNLLVSKLQSIPSVKISEWKPYLHAEAWAIISSLYYPDGGEEELSIFAESGESLRPLTNWILHENPCVKNLSMKEFYYWQEERESYRREYASLWNEREIDIIICPAGPGVAPKHNTARYWGYTALWNLLDYPALVMPVTQVDKDVDLVDKTYKPGKGKDKENWVLYDKEASDGLPVALQIVGRRFDDEKVVAFAEWLEKTIRVPFVEFP